MAWILLRLSNYQQVAPLVRTGGSRHTGLAAPPHRNIQEEVFISVIFQSFPSFSQISFYKESPHFHRLRQTLSGCAFATG